MCILLLGVSCLTLQLESRASAVFNAAKRCKLLLHCTCMCELALRTVTYSSLIFYCQSKQLMRPSRKARQSPALLGSGPMSTCAGTYQAKSAKGFFCGCDHIILPASTLGQWAARMQWA